MDNTIVASSDILSSNSNTRTVTIQIANTHCIVCGKGFEQARKGKLYCSARCKQFGYNHKTEIRELLKDQERAINPKPLIFYIDDFSDFDKEQKMLKRLQGLRRKKRQLELVDEEIKQRQYLDLPVSDFLWSQYAKTLTEEEESELYEAEMLLEERVYELVAPELSLEQWSFIKSLHLSLDKISFFELVSFISSDFLEQLSLSESNEKQNSVNLIIKNKFINHCNLIATGKIRFEKRPESEE